MTPLKLVFVTLAVLLGSLVPAQAAVTVFAAASLSTVLQGIGKSYETATHHHVVFSFAASSTLARQIEASSGADVFISADTDWMDYLGSRGLIDRSTRRNLLGNALVLIAPVDRAPAIDLKARSSLLTALHGRRLAIAEPDSVPAGIYGREALVALGIWNTVQDRLAPAENVRVALAYVARKETPLGIVYRSDALAEPRVKIVAIFPESSHKPIVYPAALTRDAKPEAKGFLAYLSGPLARAAFQKAGFTVLSP